MPADRATSEAVTPGSKDATTRRSFSSRDQRRRLSTDVITSTRGIVIGLLLGLSLGLPTFALRPQGGRHRRDTVMAEIEKLVLDAGIVIQPFWRKVYSHARPTVRNHAVHPSFVMDLA